MSSENCILSFTWSVALHPLQNTNMTFSSQHNTSPSDYLTLLMPRSDEFLGTIRCSLVPYLIIPRSSLSRAVHNQQDPRLLPTVPVRYLRISSDHSISCPSKVIYSTLTYPYTSVPKPTVWITEYLDKETYNIDIMFPPKYRYVCRYFYYKRYTKRVFSHL